VGRGGGIAVGVGDLEQAVVVEAAEVLAVDRGVAQLEDRAGGGIDGAAVHGAVDLDGAALGRGGVGVVVVQRIVGQRQLGAGVGDPELAVVGEIADAEVLDDVGRGGGIAVGVGDLEQAVVVEAAEVLAVDRVVAQLERRAGGGIDGAAVHGAVDLDEAALGRGGGGVVVVQRIVGQRQLGAGVGDPELAVVGEIADAEVLDDVGRGGGIAVGVGDLEQ